MRELSDGGIATVPAVRTGGDASQLREIVSRGNDRVWGSKVVTSLRKASDPQRGENNGL